MPSSSRTDKKSAVDLSMGWIPAEVEDSPMMTPRNDEPQRAKTFVIGMTVYADSGIEEEEVFDIADKDIQVGKMLSSSEGQETYPYEETKNQN